jgi:bacillithiol system protein YtxJ
MAALGEVQTFAREHPEVPVYQVDVRGHRALALAVGTRLGIPHESPQAILLQSGTPVWHESHYAVTAAAIARSLFERGE